MSDFPDKKSKGDYAVVALRAAVSLVPKYGGPALELIGLINTPLEKRKVDWFNDLADRLKKLEDEGFSFLNLEENDEFITIVVHATQVAIRNHEEAKLEALKNAVINTAKGINVQANLHIMFLSYIDLMSPLHLLVLKYFQDPQGACLTRKVDSNKYMMGGAATLLEDCFPELRGQRELYDTIYGDLAVKGLVAQGGLHATVSAYGMKEKRTTAMGENFIRFISE